MAGWTDAPAFVCSDLTLPDGTISFDNNTYQGSSLKFSSFETSSQVADKTFPADAGQSLSPAACLLLVPSLAARPDTVLFQMCATPLQAPRQPL